MSEISQWITFLLIGLGTFAVRLSFIEFYTVLRIPPLFRRALAYVPASVLAALVLPAVVYVAAGMAGPGHVRHHLPPPAQPVPVCICGLGLFGEAEQRLAHLPAPIHGRMGRAPLCFLGVRAAAWVKAWAARWGLVAGWEVCLLPVWGGLHHGCCHLLWLLPWL